MDATREKYPEEPPADAKIARPSATVRLRGSHSSREPIADLRRRRRDDDVPIPDDPLPPPPPPPPPVSTPDLAIQIGLCLPDELNGRITGAVREAIAPDADVRTTCRAGTQRIGVWLRPSTTQDDDAARNRGLDRLNVIDQGETFAFFISSAMIRRDANAAWDSMPKRLNGSGNPDPNGPIHLTGFSVQFSGPNRVVTRVTGFDERPWPDVDFTLSITDRLSTSGGRVSCETDRDLDVDTSWLNFLTGIFLLTIPPLGLVFLVQRIIIAAVDAPDTGAGTGCRAAMLIPGEILIPEGQKVVASYSRAEVGAGGIFAGGTFSVVQRIPEVSIRGPGQISVREGTDAVRRTYEAVPEDLRPPLRFAWSGEGFPRPVNAAQTGFRFDLSDASVGRVTRRVSVRVTDADDLVGTTDRIVEITVTPDDDDFPPICHHKPWLPQCQPEFARLRRRGDGQDDR